MKKIIALFAACGALAACGQETLSPAEQAEIIGSAARGTVVIWKDTGLWSMVPRAIAVVCESGNDGVTLAFVNEDQCNDLKPSAAIAYTTARAEQSLSMYFNASPIIATGSYHRSVGFKR